MSTIRVIYSAEPKFPAIDQHPDAVRFHVGDHWVDAIGGEPTPAEIGVALAAANGLWRKNHDATIRRQANALAEAGDQVGALLLLKTIGE